MTDLAEAIGFDPLGRIDASGVSLGRGAAQAQMEWGWQPLGRLAFCRSVDSARAPEEPFTYFEISSIDERGLGSGLLVDPDDVEIGSEEERILKKVHKGDIGRVSRGSILIPSVRPALGKFVKADRLLDSFRNPYVTTAFLELGPVAVDPRVLYWVIRHPSLLGQIAKATRVGKGYPTLKASDLSRAVAAPSELSSLETASITRIIGLDDEFFSALDRQTPERDIIDSAISECLPLAEGGETSLPTVISTNTISSSSFSFRMSPHFVDPVRQGVFSAIQPIDTVPLGRLCAQPISLGASRSGAPVGEDLFYLGPGAMTRERLDVEKLTPVDNDFFEQNRKDALKGGDVLLRRSGASLGKVMLFESDLPCICSDFIMRIRLRDLDLAPFVSYWLRSSVVQALIRTERVFGKGPANIYPFQANSLPIPNPARYDLGAIAEVVRAGFRDNHSLVEAAHEKESEIFAALESDLTGLADFGHVLEPTR